MLPPAFSGAMKSVTAENIQPRLRGAILMAVSNNEGLMLLTTGNKSEMSTGYATLYGDMCGGYSVLKDLYKTTVYKVSRWRNTVSDVIPERVLTKAPTAELKANQTDQDTLPPYELLDAILLRLVEHQLSVEETVAQGYDRETVKRVATMLYSAEYKRRQAPPGVKITGMSFGRDRRYPITSGWRG
jgi:NAD+ synthase